MKRVRVSRLAERDLDGIGSITNVFPLFFTNPEAGRRRDDVAKGVHSFPTGKYLVYYRSVDGGVVVSRVIHGMRDQRRAFHHHG